MTPDPIAELVRDMHAHGKPSLVWVVRWSADGREPVAAAWEVTTCAASMLSVLEMCPRQDAIRSWVLCALRHEFNRGIEAAFCVIVDVAKSAAADYANGKTARWEATPEMLARAATVGGLVAGGLTAALPLLRGMTPPTLAELMAAKTGARAA